jgi:hypothetical protein
MSTTSRDIAHILKPIFRARFIADGNVYDLEKRSRFNDADRTAAAAQGLAREQCTCWARAVYLRNPVNEASFRKYIGVCDGHASEGAVTRARAKIMEQTASEEDEGEFDVVRKRRLMEEAMARGDSDDDSQAALLSFEDFEAATLSALEAVHADDVDNLRRELQQMEEQGITETTGSVYFAKSEALVGYIKIGATRRHDPMLRINELSRCVPIPFQLLHYIPTLKPFNLEARIHTHFASARIRNKGAGTEFFAMTEDGIHQLPPTLRH